MVMDQAYNNTLLSRLQKHTEDNHLVIKHYTPSLRELPRHFVPRNDDYVAISSNELC